MNQQPLAQTSFQRHIWQRLLVVLVMVMAGLAVVRWHKDIPVAFHLRHLDVPFLASIDSECYVAMASGKTAEVASPFSKRWLYPFLAKSLASAAEIPLPTAFLLWNMLALAVLAYCLAVCLDILVGYPLLAVPLMLTPLTIEGIELGYIPDLFHGALLSVFFLLLIKEKIGWSLMVLFISFLARENTLILCLFGAALGYFRRNKTFLWGCLGVLVLGILATSQFAKLGQPNIHKLPDVIYLAGKVPYNFLANVMGFVIWSDIRTNVGTPWITWQLPTALRFAADKEVGFLLQWQLPLNTVLVLLTLFGTGPLLAIHFLRRWRGLLLQVPLGIQLAFLYGLVSWLLGSMLGNWVERLIGYGWPAFWIALPYLIYKAGWKMKRADVGLLLGCYFLLCWWPSVVGHTRWTPNFFLLLIIVPYYLSWRRLRVIDPAPAPSLDKTRAYAASPPAS